MKRCFAHRDEGGRYCLAQDTNAYGIIQPSQWFGFTPAPEPPPPSPGTWGDHPPMPDQITLAGDELRHDATRMALRILDDDPGDEVARALGSLGRALFGPQH